VRGDVLVADNSRLHHAEAILDDLYALLDANGIEFYLPTYSPELNPCELCFGRAKRYFWMIGASF
jgi:transposase